MNSDRIIQAIELLQRICRPLLAWFRENSRELKWRMDPLPYYVWISEIMLQQTRVEAVKPYFARFTGELEDINALANCPEDRLLKLWEGLGYYSRARNLKKAAQVIMSEHHGELPRDVSMLKALPGIGSYTSGAIASIAYGIPEPAVDGNVMRVLSRISGSKECIDEPKVKVYFEDRIREFLTDHQQDVSPGEFNQALMELGALVCLPNGGPDCKSCPVREMCRAWQEGLTDEIPVRKKKKDRRIEKRTILVIKDAEHVLIHQRPDRGLLAKLWEPVNLEGHLTGKEALSAAEDLGIFALRIKPLPDAKHIFTHVEWHMKGYEILAQEMDQEAFSGSFLAVKPQWTRTRFPIPSAFSKYAVYMNTSAGGHTGIYSQEDG